MKPRLPFIFAVLITLASVAASAQFSHLHGGSLSVGGTGQFTTVLTSNPNNVYYSYAVTPGNFATTQVSNQRQDTSWSAGFVTKLQFHPAAWAGMELNYGFNHYTEFYTFNYAGVAAPAQARVLTDSHETTAAYVLHPKHIPFQPYVGIGGGAIDFAPDAGSNQWRGAGLLETGFDIPVKNTHVGFRIGARSLYYRAPNFNTPQISTRSWRVTTEPEVSSYYRF